MSKPVFKKWTEEERRAHARARNAAYQAKRADNITLTEKRVKDQERQKKLEAKQKLEAGEWVSTGSQKKEIRVEKPSLEKIVKKNGFSALESDEEEPVEKKSTPNEYVRKKFNWADDSDSDE